MHKRDVFDEYECLFIKRLGWCCVCFSNAEFPAREKAVSGHSQPNGGTQWYLRAGEVLRPELPSVLRAGTRGSDKPAEKKNPKHQSKGELKHAM